MPTCWNLRHNMWCGRLNRVHQPNIINRLAFFQVLFSLLWRFYCICQYVLLYSKKRKKERYETHIGCLIWSPSAVAQEIIILISWRTSIAHSSVFLYILGSNLLKLLPSIKSHFCNGTRPILGVQWVLLALLNVFFLAWIKCSDNN